MNSFIARECERLGIEPPALDVALQEQYGQCGEDLIVRSLIDAAAVNGALDPARSMYVEIGGNHPVATSAGYLLEKQLGMAGHIYEPNAALVPALRAVRTRAVVYQEAVCDLPDGHAPTQVSFFVADVPELSSLSREFIETWTGFPVAVAEAVTVPAVNINEVLARCDRPVALLSIDIEGLDLEVLRRADFQRFRPYIVQVEPSDHFRRDNSFYLKALLERAGYRFIARTGVNMIFVRPPRESNFVRRARAIDRDWIAFRRLVESFFRRRP